MRDEFLKLDPVSGEHNSVEHGNPTVSSIVEHHLLFFCCCIRCVVAADYRQRSQSGVADTHKPFACTETGYACARCVQHVTVSTDTLKVRVRVLFRVGAPCSCRPYPLPSAVG